MLLFYCARAESDDEDEGAGGEDAGSSWLTLWRDLGDAERACGENIWVVDGDRMQLAGQEPDRVRAPSVPNEAILNAEPYLPPRHVTAAGGYVVRHRDGEPEVLLIFRRGVWDLPKGKLDDGETIPDCGLREVREEVGIDDLRILCGLGTTVHGYPHRGSYVVKTTHWYLMETNETGFVPQGKEGIERVEWRRWRAAMGELGFHTLRRHMSEHTADVFAVMGTGPAP